MQVDDETKGIKSTWDQWSEVYQAAYRRPQRDPLDIKCPECGEFNAHMKYIGMSESRNGMAILWCARCLVGIVIGNACIPDGFDIIPMTPDPPAEIPAFTLIREARATEHSRTDL